MNTNPPKVVVIDDELPHLTAVSDVLEKNGVQCLRIHYHGEETLIPACPRARLLIANPHLRGGVPGVDPATDYSVIGNLLTNYIIPVDAYAMLLWTRYPEHAPEFEAFLEGLRWANKPSMLNVLPKASFLDELDRVIDPDNLNRQVHDLAGRWINPTGALARIGAWGGLEDEEIDAMVEEIYAARDRCIVNPGGK